MLKDEGTDGSEHGGDRRRRLVRSMWQLNCAGSRAAKNRDGEKSDLSRVRHTPPGWLEQPYLRRAFGLLTALAAAALSAALITTKRPVEIMEQPPMNQANQHRQWLTAH
jgi:hypothetical protein